MPSTVLKFIKAKSPELLSEKIGALPFKVEIKTILKSGSEFICFFTVMDQHKGVDVGVLSGGR